jgi:uncharacterized protein YbjT (DUF2867 family)
VPPDGTVLVAGATGHVGSRVVPRLVRSGREVRALSRREQPEAAGVHWVVGDVTDGASLEAALAGCSAAYYLVHGLGETADLDEVERTGAGTFAAAAREARVERVVYLGGLARGDDLSSHLRTRREVGEILRAEGPLTIEFRASIVIGPGSASFELVRTLVDALPALVLPQWVETECQPIAVDDVVEYLVGALDLDLRQPTAYEIGGPDRIPYSELLELYGDAVGTARPTLTLPAVPLPLPDLLARVAPERARVWLKLAEGLRFDSTVRDHRAAGAFDVRPRGVREAIADALAEPVPS